MERSEIDRIFEQHWRPGWGSVAADEVECFQDVIRRERPAHFLEIGMASGMSGGLICRLLEENGGREFTTLDHDNEFFGDPTKENGFLLGSIYTGTGVTVNKRPFTTGTDLPELGQKFDMAFIDANHQHPHPTLDALCVYPFLTGSRLVFLHDLKLYKTQDVPHGIGPKYLFDQVPGHLKGRFDANDGNLGWIELSMPQEEFEEIAIDSLLLPWSSRSEMPPRMARRWSKHLRTLYSPRLVEAFELAARRYQYPLAERKPKVRPTPAP